MVRACRLSPGVASFPCQSIIVWSMCNEDECFEQDAAVGKVRVRTTPGSASSSDSDASPAIVAVVIAVVNFGPRGTVTS